DRQRIIELSRQAQLEDFPSVGYGTGGHPVTVRFERLARTTLSRDQQLCAQEHSLLGTTGVPDYVARLGGQGRHPIVASHVHPLGIRKNVGGPHAAEFTAQVLRPDDPAVRAVPDNAVTCDGELAILRPVGVREPWRLRERALWSCRGSESPLVRRLL